MRPRARGNQNFIDNTGHGQKQRRKQEVMLSRASVYILMWKSCAPLPSSLNYLPSTVDVLSSSIDKKANSTNVARVQFLPREIFVLSLVRVLALLWGFFSECSCFFPPEKPTFPNSNLIKVKDRMEASWGWCASSLNIIFLIFDPRVKAGEFRYSMTISNSPLALSPSSVGNQNPVFALVH